MSKLSFLSLLIAGALSVSLAIDGKHVNGYVVTPHYWAGWAECCACNPPARAGHILLTTIQNGAPSKTDTIYNRTLGLASAPQFNIEGKRVAFYRSSTAASANGLACATVNGGISYVSVMNRDGSNLRNLIALRAKPYDEMMLAWPAGDWIYYINPKTNTFAGRSTEIRKVNVTTQADVAVWEDANTDNWFRRFTLSLDASRIGCQNTPNGMNGVATFPGMSTICWMTACNAAVSPSGLFGGSYFSGGHTELFLSKIDGCTGLGSFSLEQLTSSITAAYRGSIEGWTAQPSLFNGAEGCELIRWAVNSDKWILQDVGWCGHASNLEGGSNPVAANWIDKTAFMVTSNPRIACLPANPDQIRKNDFTGSMWVDGGSENVGKWEDTLGVWHTVPGFSTAVKPDARTLSVVQAPATQNGNQIVLAGTGNYEMRISDVLGRTVMSTSGTGNALITTTELLQGTYYACIVRSGVASQKKLAFSR